MKDIFTLPILIISIYLLMINIFGYFIITLDKKRAARRAWRISEKKLFSIALLGGGIGEFTAMMQYKHKTRHLSFMVGIPMIIVIQIILLMYIKFHIIS